jgi:hypothetical protein
MKSVLSEWARMRASNQPVQSQTGIAFGCPCVNGSEMLSRVWMTLASRVNFRHVRAT